MMYLAWEVAEVMMSPWMGMVTVTCSSTLPVDLSQTNILPSTDSDSLSSLHWLWGYLSRTRNMNLWSSHQPCRLCRDMSSVICGKFMIYELDYRNITHLNVTFSVRLKTFCPTENFLSILFSLEIDTHRRPASNLAFCWNQSGKSRHWHVSSNTKVFPVDDEICCKLREIDNCTL